MKQGVTPHHTGWEVSHLGAMTSAAFSFTMLSNLPSYAQEIAIQEPDSFPAMQSDV